MLVKSDNGMRNCLTQTSPGWRMAPAPSKSVGSNSISRYQAQCFNISFIIHHHLGILTSLYPEPGPSASISRPEENQIKLPSAFLKSHLLHNAPFWRQSGSPTTPRPVHSRKPRISHTLPRLRDKKQTSVDVIRRKEVAHHHRDASISRQMESPVHRSSTLQPPK
jgi:hypothetical protein